ncbi:MAG: right-handed parallel beta-helix repeat-containing protein [Bacteroidota bacterium]|nr:right-handed parallel beta-helix repeat-containing protein [Bacteroidota bacterium]MDX5427280.1 right-handed parallel beta-helix repeat-containing protein [Bacteroidota bacterium]
MKIRYIFCLLFSFLISYTHGQTCNPNPIIPAPHLENFEGLTNTTYQGTWQNCWVAQSGTSSNDLVWRVNSGGTFTGGTGPLGAFHGNKYIYLESSYGNPGDSSILLTTFYDLSTLNTPGLSFYYHMFGSSINTLRIDVYDGRTWTNGLAYLNGAQQVYQSDPWKHMSVDLSSFSNDTVQFRIVGTRGGLFTGDMAIDRFYVLDLPECLMPSRANVLSVDSTHATLTWNSDSLSTSFEIIWGSVGFDPSFQGIKDSVYGDTAHLTGLNPNVQYEAYVLAKCAVGHSDTIGPVQFSTNCQPLNAGVYSINSNLITGGTNFRTFSEVAYALGCAGINGPVRFVVAPNSGPYLEHLEFDSIPGASISNQVIFDGNGEEIIWNSFPGASHKAVEIRGTKFLQLKNLKITSQGGGIFISKNAKSIKIDSCHIRSLSNHLAKHAVTAADPVLDPVEDLTISNCLIEGGGTGIRLEGKPGSTLNTNVKIIRNEIRDFQSIGIFCNDMRLMAIQRNDIHRPNNSTVTEFYGIKLDGDLYAGRIMNNSIHDPYGNGTSNLGFTYGIFADDVTAGPSFAGLVVANNIIYGMNGRGLCHGIHLTGLYSNIRLYFNTISLNSKVNNTSGTIRGIHLGSSSSLGTTEVLNNLISITDSGSGQKHGVFGVVSTANNLIDYNHYQVPVGNVIPFAGSFGGVNYYSVQDIRNGTSHETNGVQGNPQFVDPNGPLLIPRSGFGDDQGTPLASFVPNDFLGNPRNVQTPDIGAFEYSELFCDRPTHVKVDSITTGSMRVSWIPSPGADSVMIEYGQCGFLPGNGISTFSTDTFHVLNGLMDDQCYDLYISSVCNSWVGFEDTLVHGQRTLCFPYQSPFHEEFTNWPPECIYSEFDDTTLTWGQYVSTDDDFLHLKGGAVGLGRTRITFPRIQINGHNWVRFKWAHKGNPMAPGERLVLWIQNQMSGSIDTLYDVSGSDFSSPSARVYLPPLDSMDLEETHILLDSNHIGMTFWFTMDVYRGQGSDFFLDHFSVEPLPNCSEPFDVSIDSVSHNSAVISWKNLPGQFIDLEYGPCGFSLGNGDSLVSTIGSPVTLGNLQANTCYDVYLKDLCDTNWIGPFTFHSDCIGSLNGLYTIGGPTGPSNFTTLDSAMKVLTDCGVNGPVIFQLDSSNFTYTLNIKKIKGTSASNTVTFRGYSMDKTKIIATYLFPAARIDGADHIIFKNLTLSASYGGRAVWILGASNHLLFDSVSIYMPTPYNSFSSSGMVISADSNNTTAPGVNAFNIRITNSKFKGGFSSLSITGQSPSWRISNFYLKNVEFISAFRNGIDLLYTDSVTIEGCTMRNFSGVNAVGIRASHSTNLHVSQNIIDAQRTALFINEIGTTGLEPTESRIVNNFLLSGSTTVSISNSENIRFWNNNLRSNQKAFEYSGNYSTQDIRNNILVAMGTDPAFTRNLVNPSFILDHNLYYAPNSNYLAISGSGQFLDLVSWKSSEPSHNIHSQEGDPIFHGPKDLHVFSGLANDTGDASVGIAVDIDGDPRPFPGSTKIDIGADEFQALLKDIELIEILGFEGGCGDTAQQIGFSLRNRGNTPVTQIPYLFQFGGDLNLTRLGIANHPLSPGEVDTILPEKVDLSSGGTINLQVSLGLGGDLNPLNDTASISNTYFYPGVPQVYPSDTVCSNTDSVELAVQAVSGFQFAWFNDPQDSNAIWIGDTLKVPVGNKNTYYVQYQGDWDELSTPYTGGANYNGNIILLYVINHLYVKGLSLNFSSPGVHELEIYHNTGILFSPSASTWNLVQKSTFQTSTGGKHYVPLDFPKSLGPGRHNFYVVLKNGNLRTTSIPSSTFIISSNADLQVMSGYVAQYPMNSVLDDFAWNGTIHYSIGQPSCSNIRVPVSFQIDSDSVFASFTATPASVNSLTLNLDASPSIGATDYFWDFGDGSTGTGKVTSHTYLQGGNYVVTMIAVDSVCGSSDTISGSISGMKVNETFLERTIVLFPNPTKGAIEVSFSLLEKAKIKIQILNSMGQVLKEESKNGSAGRNNIQLDIGDKAEGVYYLRLITPYGLVNKKIILTKS